MRIYLTIGLLCFAQILFSQNIAEHNVRWNANEVIDGNSGKSIGESHQIESFRVDRVEWKDRRGNIIKTFSIREVNGEWTDIEMPGNILFEVDNEGRQGTIRISRHENNITIQIVLLRSDDNPEIFEFLIDSFITQ